MQKYLQGLHELFGWHSFTLDISNVDHRIQLNYDHHHNQWCLIDANQLPPKHFDDLHNQTTDSDEISRFNALFTRAIGNPQTHCCTINTQVFVNRSHALNLANTQLNSNYNNDDEQLQTLHQFYSNQIKAWSIHQVGEQNTDIDSYDLMLLACRYDHRDILRQLLNQKQLSKDAEGSNSFFATTSNSIAFSFYNKLILYAMGSSNIRASQWLLQWAETDFRSKQGKTESASGNAIKDYFVKLTQSSLQSIIMLNLSDEFIEALKQHYSNLNDIYKAHNNHNLFKNKFEDYIQQRCAVHVAAWYGNQHKLRVLINSYGGSVWLNHASRGSEYQTPLQLAAKQGHTDCVRMLINEYQQDINQSTPETNHSLLDLAIMSGEPTLIHTLITEYDFKVNNQNDIGYTPLHIAAENGQADIVKLLIDQYNANPAIASIYGPTLHVAAKHGQTYVAATLIKDYRVNPDSLIDSGSANLTALHIAAAHDHKRTASILIEEGANPTIKNIADQTPYKLALDKDHSDTAAGIMRMAKIYYTEQSIKGTTAEPNSNEADNAQKLKPGHNAELSTTLNNSKYEQIVSDIEQTLPSTQTGRHSPSNNSGFTLFAGTTHNQPEESKAPEQGYTGKKNKH